MTPFSIRDLEELLAGEIETLDGAPFDQSNGRAPPKFRESSKPISVVTEASALEHLLFSVFVQDSPNSEDRRDQAGGFAKIESNVVVFLVFNIRPPDQVADSRVASDAGLAIVKKLMSLELAPLVDVRLDNAWRPRLSFDGAKLLGEIRFTVGHDLPL